jgi:hypothetical protein
MALLLSPAVGFVPKLHLENLAVTQTNILFYCGPCVLRILLYLPARFGVLRVARGCPRCPIFARPLTPSLLGLVSCCLTSGVALYCEVDVAVLNPIGGVLCSLSEEPERAEWVRVSLSLLGAY